MPKVFVAIYTHRYGTDVRVFAKESSAEKWRVEIAEEYWDDEIGTRQPKPDKPEEMADAYWLYLLDHGNQEYFEIEHAEIEQ
jgi:hypothetical protein